MADVSEFEDIALDDSCLLEKDQEKKSDIICTICYGFMFNPHESVPCGHIFCDKCIKCLETRDCTYCKTYITKFQASAKLRRENLSLTIYCKNKDKGCEKEIVVRDIKKHLAVCQFETTSCLNGCKKTYMRKEYDEHTKECTHRTITCEACSDKIKFYLYDRHKKESCIDSIIDCINGCGKKLKTIDLVDHISICPCELISCAHNIICGMFITRDKMAEHEKNIMLHLDTAKTVIRELKKDNDIMKKNIESKILDINSLIIGSILLVLENKTHKWLQASVAEINATLRTLTISYRNGRHPNELLHFDKDKGRIISIEKYTKKKKHPGELTLTDGMTFLLLDVAGAHVWEPAKIVGINPLKKTINIQYHYWNAQYDETLDTTSPAVQARIIQLDAYDLIKISHAINLTAPHFVRPEAHIHRAPVLVQHAPAKVAAPVPVPAKMAVPAKVEAPVPAKVAAPAKVAEPVPAKVAAPAPAKVAEPVPAKVAAPEPAKVDLPKHEPIMMQEIVKMLPPQIPIQETNKLDPNLFLLIQDKIDKGEFTVTGLNDIDVDKIKDILKRELKNKLKENEL